MTRIRVTSQVGTRCLRLLRAAVLGIVRNGPCLASVARDLDSLSNPAAGQGDQCGPIKMGTAVPMRDLALEPHPFFRIGLLENLFLYSSRFRNPDLLPAAGGRLKIEKTFAFAPVTSLSPILDNRATLEDLLDPVRAVSLPGFQVEHFPVSEPKVELVIRRVLITGNCLFRRLRECGRANKTSKTHGQRGFSHASWTLGATEGHPGTA